MSEYETRSIYERLADRIGSRRAADGYALLFMAEAKIKQLDARIADLEAGLKSQYDTSKYWQRCYVELEARGAEPVAATIKLPDPYDEREGLWFSREDLERLSKLPSGTKLYTAPPAADEALREDAERYRWLMRNAMVSLEEGGVIEIAFDMPEYQPYHGIDSAIDAHRASQAGQGE